ncbi:MAG: hypothetical protein ACRCYU_06555 [Nocardioides sp.]
MIFTSVDYDKFRALCLTHGATRFEELANDEANDHITPEKRIRVVGSRPPKPRSPSRSDQPADLAHW